MNSENRELEIWIAKTIFGAEITRTPSLVNDAYMQTESDKHLMMSPYPVPRYTTDPAAALSVLEKCIEKTSIAQSKGTTGYMLTDLDKKSRYAIAETLPMCVALFAQKLFSK